MGYWIKIQEDSPTTCRDFQNWYMRQVDNKHNLLEEYETIAGWAYKFLDERGVKVFLLPSQDTCFNVRIFYQINNSGGWLFLKDNYLTRNSAESIAFPAAFNLLEKK